MKERLVVVDVETTGIDADKYSLVSIGAVKINDPNDTFYGECDIWPGAAIDSGALRVNGMKIEEITAGERQSEAELTKAFVDWLPKDPIMIAHNASFDRDFIDAACKRGNINNPFGFRTLDVHTFVFMHLMRKGENIPKNLSLNNCLKSLGLPPEPNPHNALTGAQCEAQLFDKVLNYNGDEQKGIFA